MLTGHFEAVDYYDGTGWVAKGWAFDDAHPNEPVALEMWSQNGSLGRFRADLPRPDLASAGFGDGKCAFEFLLPGSLLDGQAHILQIVAIAARQALSNSPQIFTRPRFRGQLEGIEGLVLHGWAKDDLAPERGVLLDLLIDGKQEGRIECSIFRGDLPESLGTLGHNSFQHAIPTGLCDDQAHELLLRFSNTDQILSGSPITFTLPRSLLPPALSSIDQNIYQLERRLADANLHRQRMPIRWLMCRQRYQSWLTRHEGGWNRSVEKVASRRRRTFSVIFTGVVNRHTAGFMQQLADQTELCRDLLCVRLPTREVQIDRLRTVNGLSMDEVLSFASGDYIVLLPEQYRPHSSLLATLAADLEEHEVAAVYVDEDSVDETGERHSPHFKPDWDPDRFLATGYANGILCLRRADLLTMFGEQKEHGPSWPQLAEDMLISLPSDQIRHIPRVLAHRVVAPDESATDRAVRLQEALRKFGCPALAEAQANGTVRLRWPLPCTKPAITLIIPTRDRLQLLRTCVESILERTDYPNFHILIVDNGSTEQSTLQYLGAVSTFSNVKVIRRPGVFNFSALNNDAVAEANTPMIGLVNNDVEVIHSDWLDELVSQAVRCEVGAVGAKLLYPDGSIQHGGVIVGMHGAADNAQKGFMEDESGYFQSAIAVQQVSAVTAACLICRKEVYQAVGGMDATLFPVSFNDVDFCLKVRARGLRIIWTPHARLLHHESATRGAELSNETRDIEKKEADRLRKKWNTESFIDPFYSRNISRENYSYSDFADNN